jgi:PAP2 superfamily
LFRQDLNLDERLLLLARTRGHSPGAERAVAAFSRLGEHGALWLAIGWAGALREGRRGESGRGESGRGESGRGESGRGGDGRGAGVRGDHGDQGARRGRWRTARRTVLAAYALNTALKFTIRRRRPSLPGLPPLMGTTTGLSFPSAHAATSFAGALAYSRLGVPRLPLYGAAGAMALSRVYLGVHYPSDVLAGALEGTLVAAALTAAGGEDGA